jgi:uncharacterized protein (TIGR02996 family)
MSAEEAFLQAIYDAPHDDAPRMVFADWLEEHGQAERGDFIRVQCRLAQMEDDDPRRPELERRERALLRSHGAQWKAGDDPHVRYGAFRRGFVVPRLRRLSAREFLRLKPEAFRAAPLWQARLVNVLTSMERLAASPNLGRLCGLHIAGEWLVDDGHVRQLAGSPYLGNLTTLNLAHNSIHDLGVEALAGCPGLARLACLDLTRVRISDVGARALAASPHLTRLRALRLGGIKHGPRRGRISPFGVRALAESAALANLTDLDMSDCLYPGNEAAVALAGASFLPSLRDLNLEDNALTARGLIVLLRSPRLGRLRSLRLSGNALRVAGAQALAATPGLASLNTLDVWGTGLTDAGAQALAESPYLTGLTELILSDNTLTDAAARALAAAPGWPRLRRLVVRINRFTPAARNALRRRWGKRVEL